MVPVADLAAMAPEEASSLRLKVEVTSTARSGPSKAASHNCRNCVRLEALVVQELGVGERVACIRVDRADGRLAGSQMVGVARIYPAPPAVR